MKTQYKHLLQRTYLVLVFGFMYLPIAVLIAYSFNENKSRAVFTGFSLKWYASLFHNEMILSALGLSLVLAFVSAIIATVLGTLATIGINSMSRKAQLIINNISYVPVVNPEIITGVSLMLLFVIVLAAVFLVSLLGRRDRGGMNCAPDSKHAVFFGGEEAQYSHVASGDLFWGFKHNLRHYLGFVSRVHTGVTNDYVLWGVTATAVIIAYCFVFVL